jgi:hypothetical protein
MGTSPANFGRLVSAFHNDLDLVTPNTIRGTDDYRKFSQSRQHLAAVSHRNTASHRAPPGRPKGRKPLRGAATRTAADCGGC